MYIHNHAGGRNEPYCPHPQHMAGQCSLSHKGIPQLRDRPDNTGTGSVICTAMVDSLADWVCTCYLVQGTDLTMGLSTVCYTGSIICTAVVGSLGDGVCACYLVWGTNLTFGLSTVCYTGISCCLSTYLAQLCCVMLTGYLNCMCFTWHKGYF